LGGKSKKGQREIIEKVQKKREKEKCIARSMGIEITEFEVGSFVLVEHVQNKLRRGPDSKLLPFLKGPMKVINRRDDIYTLRNLVTNREKDYHVKRLHQYHYDPNTISPLKAACKEDTQSSGLRSIVEISKRGLFEVSSALD
jgi:hypothetical protein